MIVVNMGGLPAFPPTLTLSEAHKALLMSEKIKPESVCSIRTLTRHLGGNAPRKDYAFSAVTQYGQTVLITITKFVDQ